MDHVLRRTRFLTVAGLVAGLAAAAVPALAQQQPQPEGAPPTTSRLVTIGCISRSTTEPPRFLITDARGQEPLTYQLDGDPEQLRIHVGHLVEIVGPSSPAQQRAGTGPNIAAVVKVQRLVYISKSCDPPK